MDVYFGVGGELLTPLDEMLDGDIKLSLELDLELKDPINNGLAACTDDWGGWGSLRTSPSLDLFGDKENCIMVSPEAVMPFIKREIKQEPPPSPPSAPNNSKYRPHDSLDLECEEEEEEEEVVGHMSHEPETDEEVEEEEVEAEEEEEDEEEEEEEEEEEHVMKEIRILPKERSLWNSAIVTKPTIIKQGSVGMTTYHGGRPKTEIIVSKNPSTTVQPQQTVRVLHATKKSIPNESSPSSRTMVVKRLKEGEGYPKPAYSYSCLIAMALKNSITGSLPVSEIYNFMCEHFPYFKSAPVGWKNSVRHNLSLNKCFEKIEKGGAGGGCRKGCLWAMNPAKIAKMEDEVAKWSKKDPTAIRRAMRYPDELERLERGDLKIGSLRGNSYDSGAEEEESSASSDSDTEEVPPSLKRFDSRLSSQESNDLGLPDEMYEELGLLEEVMSSDAETEPGPEVKRIRLGIDSYQRQPVRPV